jgi:multidrug resistance efflux pump
MIARLKNRWVLIGGVLIVLSLSAVACAQLAPTILPRITGALSDQPEDLSDPSLLTVAIATPGSQLQAGSAGRLTAVVTRGTVTDQIPLTGRIVGTQEFPITFPGVGKVESVPIKQGDVVKEGQLLVQTSSADLAKQLDTARANLETDQIRFDQGQAQASAQETARQRDAAANVQDASSRRQTAVADAQAALTAAQAEQQKVLAGPSESEKRSAEVAITAAQTNTQRAQADLDHQTRGTDPAELRSAQRDIDVAQNDVNKVQADLDALTAGPDPGAVTSAQRDVQRTQNALSATQADKSSTGTAHDASVANARLNVQDAEDRLNRLSVPANPLSVSAARLNVQAAQARLDNARARLAALQSGPDQGIIDQAQAVLDSAQKNQENAQALLDDLNSHPRPDEVRVAAGKVAAAQAAVDRARTQPLPAAPDTNAALPYDFLLQQKSIEQDQALIEKLQASLSTTMLVAPFDGTVASVSIKVTDPVDVGQTVVVLVKPGDPIVRVDLTDKDAARLAVGQNATVRAVTAPDGTVPAAATVTALANSTTGPGKVAQFTVNWAGTPAALGAAVQIQLTVEKKDNVLTVPRKAIRSAGARRYVQYQEGPSRKTANVEVGIVAGDTAEIVSGLTEGQVVLVGP